MNVLSETIGDLIYNKKLLRKVGNGNTRTKRVNNTYLMMVMRYQANEVP